MLAAPSSYPSANLEVEYPEAPRNRLTVAFRIFTAIPILILLGMVSGGSWSFGDRSQDEAGFAAAGGILFLGPAVMILFRNKYPRWWFDWNAGITAFTNRVFAYLLLLRDEYPSTDEEQAVHVDLEYPDVPNDLTQWMPLVKWFLAIPHYFVLFFLGIAVFVVTIIAWFAVLFTGTYPRGMFEFVTGVMRWGLRVSAYVFLNLTDKYPPFSLQR